MKIDLYKKGIFSATEININDIDSLELAEKYLDCIKKTITFNVKEQSYIVDLTEGDLHDSQNTISYEGQLYDTSFTWSEEAQSPSFTITPVKEVKGGKGEDPYFEADWDGLS